MAENGLPHPAVFPPNAIRDCIAIARNPQVFRDDPGHYLDQVILALHWSAHAVFGEPKALARTASGVRDTAKWDATGLHKVRKVSAAQAARAMEELLKLHDEDPGEDAPPKSRKGRKAAKHPAGEEHEAAEVGADEDYAEAGGISPSDARASVAAGVGASPIGPMLFKFLLNLLLNLTGA